MRVVVGGEHGDGGTARASRAQGKDWRLLGFGAEQMMHRRFHVILHSFAAAFLHVFSARTLVGRSSICGDCGDCGD